MKLSRWQVFHLVNGATREGAGLHALLVCDVGARVFMMDGLLRS